jgi:hypothetical protein
MTLLRDIQKDAIDSNVDITMLLRKCKVLAARLKHEAFSKWVESELNGYKPEEKLPDYRMFDVQSYGNFSGPFGSGLNNAPIPPSCLPEKFRYIVNKVYLVEGISTYISLGNSEKGKRLSADWPADIVAVYGGKIYENMNCIGAWQVIGSGQIQGLIDTVRNRVLSFVLEVESQDPDAGEASSKDIPIPKEKVNQIYQTYILGNVGNVSAGGINVSQVSFLEVTENDIATLLDFLRTLKISDDDIKDMQTAIEKDGKPNDSNSLGKNVSIWLGKMVSKAASGVWKVSSSVAADVLSKAILKYYGIE